MAKEKELELEGRYPCEIEGKFLRPCAALDRITDGGPSSGRSKGFFLDTYMNFQTGELTMSFIRIKLGEWQKNGIVANFCPFCGVNIRNHVAKDKNDGD